MIENPFIEVETLLNQIKSTNEADSRLTYLSQTVESNPMETIEGLENLVKYCDSHNVEILSKPEFGEIYKQAQIKLNEYQNAKNEQAVENITDSQAGIVNHLVNQIKFAGELDDRLDSAIITADKNPALAIEKLLNIVNKGDQYNVEVLLNPNFEPAYNKVLEKNDATAIANEIKQIPKPPKPAFALTPAITPESKTGPAQEKALKLLGQWNSIENFNK